MLYLSDKQDLKRIKRNFMIVWWIVTVCSLGLLTLGIWVIVHFILKFW